MTLAAELAEVDLPFRLRLLLFGSEEVGLLGSRHYVDSLAREELDSIIAMINLDSTGSGQALEAIGDGDLITKASDYAKAKGITLRTRTPPRWGGSDHAPFADAGSPVLFLYADDLSRINSPRDGIEFVRPELMGEAAAIALEIVDQLARDR
jgi:aminopeptidase YwaD